MAIKLHRCNWMWFKAGMHPCWRVQSALDEMKDLAARIREGRLEQGSPAAPAA